MEEIGQANDADLLAPVTMVDEAGLRLEKWTNRLRGCDFTKIVRFARSTRLIRTHGPSVTALNGIMAAAAEIRSTGQDLQAGTVKTMNDARNALVSLIAAQNVPAQEFHDHLSTQIDSQSLEVKKKVAESATNTFGHVTGAPSGAVRSCTHLTSRQSGRWIADARRRPAAAGSNERSIDGCLGSVGTREKVAVREGTLTGHHELLHHELNH